MAPIDTSSLNPGDLVLVRPGASPGGLYVVVEAAETLAAVQPLGGNPAHQMHVTSADILAVYPCGTFNAEAMPQRFPALDISSRETAPAAIQAPATIVDEPADVVVRVLRQTPPVGRALEAWERVYGNRPWQQGHAVTVFGAKRGEQNTITYWTEESSDGLIVRMRRSHVAALCNDGSGGNVEVGAPRRAAVGFDSEADAMAELDRKARIETGRAVAKAERGAPDYATAEKRRDARLEGQHRNAAGILDPAYRAEADPRHSAYDPKAPRMVRLPDDE